MSLEPPTPGWVSNLPVAHRAWAKGLGACYWGDWSAPLGTGGIRHYQWGIGLRPNGTDILPFQYSPYTREGRVPALLLPDNYAALEFYCTVRATTAAGIGVTASSPPFRVCTAVANATVSVPATQGWTHELCATWAVASDDPGAGCVVRQAWAIGHQPLGTSVMDFVEVPTGAGACARVPLLDGEEYYVTLQLQGASDVVAAFTSPPVYTDGSPPEIRDLQLRISVAGAESAHGTVFAPVAGTANLTASWDVSEPHSPNVDITLEFLEDEAVVAAAAVVAAPHAGQHTVALPLVGNATYRCRARVSNRAALEGSGGSNTVLVDGTAPVAGRVRDGRDPGADAEWQQSTRRLGVTWDRFSDPESRVQRVEVCFGTAPGPLCDVSPFTPATHPVLHVHEVVGAQPLAAGVTYFGTVRAWNGAGLYTDVSSDGVTVDTTPPMFARSALVRLASGATATASHNVSVVWDAAGDGVSGVAGYTVDVGTQPYGAGIHRAVPVGPSLGASLQLPRGPPEYPFYVTVHATDNAGWSSAIRSQRLTLDTSPPEVGPLRFARGDRAALALPVPPPLPHTGFYVFLDNCEDLQTGITRVSWRVRAANASAPSAAGDVREGLQNWFVGGLPATSGRYHVTVEAENGVGLRAQREAVVDVDATGPSEGTVWDGAGAVDLEVLGVGSPVVTQWKGLWDTESDVTLLEYTLEERRYRKPSITVLPWREVTGDLYSVQAPLAVGKRYGSRLRVTNEVGLSVVLRTDGFNVVPNDGDWVSGDSHLSSLCMCLVIPGWGGVGAEKSRMSRISHNQFHANP